MSVLLFRLNNVPEAEANAVRELLEINELDFYETSAGTFGISVAAIWLCDKQQLPHARQLIADFQAEHSEAVREAYRESLQRGEAETFWTRLRSERIKVVLYLLAVLVILYISIVPWLDAWT